MTRSGRSRAVMTFIQRGILNGDQLQAHPVQVFIAINEKWATQRSRNQRRHRKNQSKPDALLQVLFIQRGILNGDQLQAHPAQVFIAINEKWATQRSRNQRRHRKNQSKPDALLQVLGEDLPPDIKDWSKRHVRRLLLKLDGVDDSVAERLFQEDINGPKTVIIRARDEVVKLQKEGSTSSTNFPGGPCKPYPFCHYDHAHRYRQDSILDVTESGVLNFIEPCHEFKGFYNTPDESKMSKFTYEVLCFASACMNSRTNGTIHFGIWDKC
nr:uncharacterized protein LOC114918939 [Labrus bergylta]